MSTLNRSLITAIALSINTLFGARASNNRQSQFYDQKVFGRGRHSRGKALNRISKSRHHDVHRHRKLHASTVAKIKRMQRDFPGIVYMNGKLQIPWRYEYVPVMRNGHQVGVRYQRTKPLYNISQ